MSRRILSPDCSCSAVHILEGTAGYCSACRTYYHDVVHNLDAPLVARMIEGGDICARCCELLSEYIGEQLIFMLCDRQELAQLLRNFGCGYCDISEGLRYEWPDGGEKAEQWLRSAGIDPEDEDAVETYVLNWQAEHGMSAPYDLGIECECDAGDGCIHPATMRDESFRVCGGCYDMRSDRRV